MDIKFLKIPVSLCDKSAENVLVKLGLYGLVCELPDFGSWTVFSAVFFGCCMVDPVKLLTECPHIREPGFHRNIQNTFFGVRKKAAGMR